MSLAASNEQRLDLTVYPVLCEERRSNLKGAAQLAFPR
jgi:hypothetical protein